MNTFTCSVQPCDATKYEALGMCRTHYRRSRPRKPDAKVPMPCDGCGSIVMKEKRARRYDTVQCSDRVCRTWLTFGIGWASKLPADHMARLKSFTCDWAPPTKPALKLTSGQCIDCAAWFVTIGAASQSPYCSVLCNSRAQRRRRRAREHNAPGSFRYSEIMRMYLALGKVCAYCGQAAIGLPDPEHVMPLSRGGRNDRSNLLPACRACNTDKNDLTLTEWAADRARRGLAPVRTTFDVTRPEYRHLMLTLPSMPAWRDRASA